MRPGLVSCLLVLAFALPHPGRAAPPVAEPDLRVVLLGTASGPVMYPDRVGVGTLVLAGDKALLFDAGRGVPRALQRVSRPGAVDAVFLTHLHSDHVVALPELLLFPWASDGRRTPLRVFGPEGTSAMMEHLSQAFAFDIHMRRDVDERFPAAGIEVEATEIAPGVVYEADGLTVTAFLVDHAPVAPAYGYRVDFRGRSVVLSGDTRPSPSVVRFARGADVLVHSAGPWKEQPVLQGDPDERLPRGLTRGQLRAIAEHHTDPVEAGAVFAQARPRLAIVSHYPMDPRDIQDLVRRTYDGAFEVGTDGMSISVGDQVTVVR